MTSATLDFLKNLMLGSSCSRSWNSATMLANALHYRFSFGHPFSTFRTSSARS